MNAGFEVAPEEAQEPLILALDVGTSSARALVYDGRGRRVETWEAHHPYELTTTPDGGAVVDADALVELSLGCIDAVLDAAGRASRSIAAVACDTFWHSLLGVGRDGRAVTPLYTWADTRSSAAADELRRRLDAEAVHDRTGAVLHSSYPPSKLLWLSQTRPDLLGRSAYWMSFGEYLYLRLFGQRRVSVSMASGSGLFDQNTCTWDDQLIDVLPIRQDQLSPIADYTAAMSKPVKEVADRWPALRQVPWYLALGDGACNNIGSGGVSDEWVVAMIGTSGALRVVREVPHVDIPHGLWTYRVDHRRFVQGGAFSNGGNLFAWLEQTLRLAAVQELEEELARMAPDRHGLTVLPFLAGERSPDWKSGVHAAIVGMSLDTHPLDIARACLEAVAYRFGVVYDILCTVIPNPRGIIGSGAGLIHSPAWMQMLSDVLERPMIASAAREATSRGAALLVLEAMGTISDVGALPAPFGAEYAPVAANSRAYRSGMERQERLYQVLYGPSAAWSETG